MFAPASTGGFRLDAKTILGIAASILTLAAIVFYFNVYLRLPVPGFVVNNHTGVVLHVTGGYAVDEESRDLLPGGERLQVGDQISQIGETQFMDYVEDRTTTIYRPFADDQPVKIKFKREAQEHTIHVLRQAEWRGALSTFAALFMPMLFWAMGTLTVVFLYPRDDRWLLMVLFQYDMALLISTGFVGFTQESYSAVLYFIFLAFFCPLSIHLHLILPDAPFRRYHRWLLPSLYSATLVALILFGQNKLPRATFYAGALIAVVVSLSLVVLRAFTPSAPTVKIARRAMFYGLGMGLAPPLSATVAYWFNPVGLVGSIYDEIIVGALLLVVPIWLCTYIFAIYKHDLGYFEFRANRLLGIYGFFYFFVALYLTVFDVAVAAWQSAGWGQKVDPATYAGTDLKILSLVVSLLFVIGGQSLYARFQGWVDRHIFNIKYQSSEVIGAFAERIPTASSREILQEVVVDEILPALSIRQSGLYLFGQGDAEILYEQAVPEISSGPELSELLELATNSGYFIQHGAEPSRKFSWVRVALPLSIPEKTIGIWLLGKRDPDDYYSHDDIQLLKKLANQIGPVVENFKLVEQARLEVEENRRLQEQLIHSQKMEAIGRLSAGVAHDFNNILSVIIGYSNLVMTQYRGDANLQRSMKSVKDAGERAAALTRQLLAFSRQQVMEVQVTSINVIVGDIEKMLRRLAGEDMELVTELDAELPRVKVDPGQMDHVIINLVVNARDAMPEGGQILIQTRKVLCRAGDALFDKGMSPGTYAMLRIEDSGTGIESGLLANIFEPYFTTKELGKGTGLGLSMVYGIISQSNGHVFVDSELGRGTRFDIYLPATDSNLAEPEKLRGSRERGNFGTETVLLVEDEDSVRAVAAEILEANGYTVIKAENGVRAIDKFERNREKIDLLLTDVVMPHMRGTELARRLLEREPQLKVLYMSGYSEQAAVSGRLGETRRLLIHKPFSPEKLARAVRKVLDGRNIDEPEPGLKMSV